MKTFYSQFISVTKGRQTPHKKTAIIALNNSAGYKKENVTFVALPLEAGGCSRVVFNDA
jgi:hypothetical protein